MIQVIACPYLLFVWPHKGMNPSWSFIWGQSLCLQWHHKCLCRDNNGWWISAGVGHTGQSRIPKLPVSWKVLQTGDPRLDQTMPSAPKMRDQIAVVVLGIVAGRRKDNPVITLNVSMKLCVCWRQSEMAHCSSGGRKTLCFYRLPGMR